MAHSLVAHKAAVKTKSAIASDDPSTLSISAKLMNPHFHPDLAGLKTTSKMFGGNEFGTSNIGFHGSVTPDSVTNGGSTICGHASGGWTDPSGSVDISGNVGGCITHPTGGGVSGSVNSVGAGITLYF